MFLTAGAFFVQPTAAQAQNRYDRGGYYDSRANRNGFRNDRDFDGRQWREQERRQRAWERERERRWREHQRWERRNYWRNYSAPRYYYGPRVW